MSENCKVVAIVVTYNRRELLAECLEGLFSQTFPVHEIILIDNASTDGTDEYVASLNSEVIRYHKLASNTGGAGGFCHGLNEARNMDCDWVWVMDDDTIPSSTALEELLKGYEDLHEDVSFLCSAVYGPDGEYMNVPNIATSTGANGYRDWYKNLKHGAVKVADATFVSTLINKKALDKCGLPCADFFIWGDDTEYTMRIIRNYGPAYIIGKSEVCHKRFNSRRLSIKEEDNVQRIDMYVYFFRNILIIRRLYLSGMTFFSFLIGAIRTSLTSLFTVHGFRKFITIHKGIWQYFTRLSHFRNYIDSQLKGSEE